MATNTYNDERFRTDWGDPAVQANAWNDNRSTVPQPTAPVPAYNPPPAYGQQPPVNPYYKEPSTVDQSYPVAASAPDPNVFDLKNFTNRQAFIKKVYLVLAVQLFVTFLPIIIMAALQYGDPDRFESVKDNDALFWSAWAVQIVAFFALMCCSNGGRKFPMNIILLGAFTLAEAYMLTVISLHYSTQSVAIAVGATMGVTLIVSAMATFTKFDFTKLLPAVSVVFLGWIFCCFFFIWIPWTEAMVIVYAAIGVTFFTIFLAIDTKLVLGGGKYEYGPDDYIFAALNLYLDIVRIFMYFLMIFGSGD